MKSLKTMIPAVSMAALLALPLSAEVVVLAYEFETPNDVEGWTAPDTEWNPIPTLSQRTAVGGGTEGVLYGETPSNDPKLGPNTGFVDLDQGYTWHQAIFRVRHLSYDEGSDTYSPKAFDPGGTILIFTHDGATWSAIHAHDPEFSFAPDAPDGGNWTLMTYDLSGYGSSSLDFVRFDPIGDETGDAFEIDYVRFTAMPPWDTDFADLTAPVHLDFGEGKESVADLLRIRRQDFLLQADSVRYEPTSSEASTGTALASISNYTAGQSFVVESDMTVTNLPSPGPTSAGLVVLGGPHVPGITPFTSSEGQSFYTLSLYPGETSESAPLIQIREGYTGTILAEEVWQGQPLMGAGDSFADDFENIAASQAAWTSGGTNNLWEVGQPTSGPGQAYTGQNVFATKLDGAFRQTTEAWLRSPAIDLTGIGGAVLRYADWHQLDTELQYHSARVSILDAATNAELEVLSNTAGLTGGWRLQQFTLSEASLGREVVIEFRLTTDDFVDVPGWYIDDVELIVSAPALTLGLSAQGLFNSDGSLNLSFTASEGSTEQTISAAIGDPFIGNLFGIGGRSRVQDGIAPAFDFDNLSIALGAAPSISAIADQRISINSSTGALPFTVDDAVVDPSSLTVEGTSSNPGLVPDGNIVVAGEGSARTVTVTPLPNVDGMATITLAVTGGSAPASTSFRVNVVWPEPPTITEISDRTVYLNASTGAIPFTVGHEFIAPGDLAVSGLSSNAALVPDGNIVFGGSGASRTVTVTPAIGASGTATIAVTVGDGLQSESVSFELLVLAELQPAVNVVINPTEEPSPEVFLARAWHWDIDGDQEGWTVGGNGDLVLVPGAPLNGLITGTAIAGDPMWVSPENLGIGDTGELIIEFRVRKEIADGTRMDLFWADSNGGFAGNRVHSVDANALPRDGEFHVVRIYFINTIQGALSQLRLDPISDPPGIGMTIDIDYFRIYTAGGGVAVPPPSLAIDRVSGTGVRISWPAEATGWTLERSSDISGGFEDAGLEVVIEDDEHAAYDAIIDPRQFYRLIK